MRKFSKMMVSALFTVCLFGFYSCAVVPETAGSKSVIGKSTLTASALNANDYASALKLAIQFYDANKCGSTAGVNNAFTWRGNCHTADQIPTGFHDAGDHVKFGLPAAYTFAILGWSLYEYPNSFSAADTSKLRDDVLKRFSDYFMAAYNKTAKTFVYQIANANTDHTYWGAPETQTGTRQVYINSYSQGYVDVGSLAAAGLAMMYLHYKNIDADYANRCLDSATNLYFDVKANQKYYIPQDGFYGYNQNTTPSVYDSLEIQDKLALAAGFLYLADPSKEALYYADTRTFLLTGNNRGGGKKTLIGQAVSWNNLYPAAFQTAYENAQLENNTADMTSYFDSIQTNNLYLKNTQPYTTESGEKHMVYLNYWGSCKLAAAVSMTTLLQCRIQPDQGLQDWAKAQVDYILGDNANQYSYLIGFGANYPKQPHHRAANPYQGNALYVLSGGLVSGPDSTGHYTDSVGQYLFSEVAIDYNATMVGALAALIHYTSGNGSSSSSSSAISSQSSSQASASVVNSYGLLKVVGNKVCDKNGNPVQLRGMSLFWSIENTDNPFYNANAVYNLASTWNASIIRAAMTVEGAGYLANPVKEKNKVITVVDAAISNGIYVIIDWHDHNALSHTAQARAFFQEMALKYGNVPNIIFEIFNEPLNTASWTDVKNYSETIIGDIRGKGAQNLVVVGTPSWSQDVDVAASNPITKYGNLAYSLHFYAGSHKQALRDKALSALNKGCALFVSEWGTCDATVTAGLNLPESQIWLNFLDQHKISSCNWSLNTKNEFASALVPSASTTGPWPDSQMTESGKFVKKYIQAAWSQQSSSTSSMTGTAQNVPGKIEAESYAAMSGIQTEATSDSGGGLDVGWVEAGDWMDYTINATQAGLYSVDFRVASPNTGTSFELKAGAVVLCTVAVPNTGGWQNWTTVSKTITLSAGTQTIRTAFNSTGININYLSFLTQTVSSASSSVSSSVSSSPAGKSVPGKIEAESYNSMTGIQTEACTEGTLNVGWVDTGDWLDYSINAAQAGNYQVELRAASMAATGIIDILIDGVKQVGVAVPNTGGWQTWTSVFARITIASGNHTLRLSAAASPWNLNYINITADSTSSSFSSRVSSAGSSSSRSSSLSSRASSAASTSPVTLNSWQCNANSGGLTIWTGGVGNWDAGEWIQFNNVNLGSGFNTISFNYATTLSGNFDVRLDSATGPSVANLVFSTSGAWDTYKTGTSSFDKSRTGIHSIFVRCVSGAMNLGVLKLYN